MIQTINPHHGNIDNIFMISIFSKTNKNIALQSGNIVQFCQTLMKDLDEILHLGKSSNSKPTL